MAQRNELDQTVDQYIVGYAVVMGRVDPQENIDYQQPCPLRAKGCSLYSAVFLYTALDPI